MNPAQPYMDVSSGHAPASHQYQPSSYGQPQALQPASQQYQPGSYGAYQTSYSMAPMVSGHPVTTPMSQAMVPSGHLPPTTMPAPGAPGPGGPNYSQSAHQFDSTGQIAPQGMKPRVTATLWEDEGSLCFQVEAAGVCVARREDNHMINGTKLLNVAGMTRGRRDGILKSEKTRHVVKIGPMHLKGVWIPFDRALDFANKEKITELLYPLFVHNIGALLYHPSNNNSRASIQTGLAARRNDSQTQQDYMRTPTGTQPPSLTHHHTLSNPVGPSQPPHAIAPHPASGRPGLDRAHTFPTPPASASSLMGMGNAGSSYTEYQPQTNPMHPSSSTPTSASQNLPYGGQQYDSSRNVYATPAYNQYPSNQQYGHSANAKPDMSGQARGGAENDGDNKPGDGYSGHQDGEASDGVHGRAIHHDAHDIAPSPQQNGSGRATPRTNNTYAAYATPQRAGPLPSSNLYNVITNDGRPQNGTEPYQPQAYQPQQSQYPAMNGLPTSAKRAREIDDGEDQYGRSVNSPGAGIKRQRTDSAAINPRPISQPHSVKPVR